MVLPYKASEVNCLKNHAFNKQLSYLQIYIKLIFGILKRRQKSLKKIPLIITDNKKFKFACMWITAFVILHNIFIDLNDN